MAKARVDRIGATISLLRAKVVSARKQLASREQQLAQALALHPEYDVNVQAMPEPQPAAPLVPEPKKKPDEDAPAEAKPQQGKRPQKDRP